MYKRFYDNNLVQIFKRHITKERYDPVSRDYILKQLRKLSMKNLEKVQHRNIRLPHFMHAQPKVIDDFDSSKRKAYLEYVSMEDVTHPDIEYDIWQNYLKMEDYLDMRKYPNGYIKVAPVKLIQTFGYPHPPDNDYLMHKCGGQYQFEDSNTDTFILYEWRNTLETASNSRKLQTTRTSEEFWKSNKREKFYIKSTKYADLHSFKMKITDLLNAERETTDGYILEKDLEENPINDWSDYHYDYTQLRDREAVDPLVLKYQKFVKSL